MSLHESVNKVNAFNCEFKNIKKNINPTGRSHFSASKPPVIMGGAQWLFTVSTSLMNLQQPSEN